MAKIHTATLKGIFPYAHATLAICFVQASLTVSLTLLALTPQKEDQIVSPSVVLIETALKASNVKLGSVSAVLET